MTAKNKILYAKLVDMADPEKVFAEVLVIMKLVNNSLDRSALEKVFQHICALYNGECPGYRSCNTHYHDLRHVTDVLLALARLIHGAHEAGHSFTGKEVVLALMSSLMHDTGYIQKTFDRDGTGGKYTLTHVTRSVEFLEEYCKREGFGRDDKNFCRALILGTSLSTPFEQLQFPSPNALLLGKLVATADFLGQIADRLYLEKLLFLYREFQEAHVLGYASELELLTKTIRFYDIMQERLVNNLSNVQKYMQHHFRVRWQIDRDLYQEAVNNNIAYLEALLKNQKKSYRSSLKREGVVARLEELERGEAEKLLGDKTRPDRWTTESDEPGTSIELLTDSTSA